MSDTLNSLRPPSPWLLLLEARAPWEYAATLAAMPLLNRLPRGDGHPVIVFPGLGAADISTAPLRNFLQDLGYSAYPWKQGFNFGPRRGVLDAVRQHVQRIADRHGEPVSLVLEHLPLHPAAGRAPVGVEVDQHRLAGAARFSDREIERRPL